jgi:tetratricopeptide (TPR) repeat protein
VPERRYAFRIVATLLVAVLLSAPSAAEAGSFDLYRQGRIDAARAAYRQELSRVEAGGDAAALWAQLMYIGWLEESLGEPRRSLEYSNRALETAVALADSFRIGRSLCWIGWSFASLGLYDLALEFFDRAISLGAPEGRIRHVAVWGLATQEKGWVLARLGRLEEARGLLEETTRFARNRGIDVGVAEGGAHLAEIALLQGQLASAEALADEALRAALRCDCRDANTARAMVVVSRVSLARARVDPKFEGEAREKARAAVEFARRVSDRRNLAEARLVLSRALPPDALERRLSLAEAAVEALSQTGSELRGRAQAELGRVLADAELAELARFYLASGFEISESLFRKVDSAFILTDLADLDWADRDREAELAKRADAARRATAARLLPLALDNQEVLSQELLRLGYALHALRWTEEALETLARLLETTQDHTVQRQLLARRFALSERLAEIHLALSTPELPAPR